jgi:hypothetical protein
MLAAILTLVLGLFAGTASATDSSGTVDVVVRLYLDANNDVNDRGEPGVGNRNSFTVQLRGPGGSGINLTGTPGPRGFVSFNDLPDDYVGQYRLNVQFNGNGWQLARNNANAFEQRGRTWHYASNFITIPEAAFIDRVNGDTEAWVRFSFIRDPRITISGATPGDIFTVTRVANNRVVGTDNVGPGGFASFVRNGLFYGQAYEVTSDLTTNSIICTIPFGYQPSATVSGDQIIPGRACS